MNISSLQRHLALASKSSGVPGVQGGSPAGQPGGQHSPYLSATRVSTSVNWTV